MSEVATINNVTQIGVESTPGTAVPANKLLQALSIEPAVKTSVQTVRPAGAKYITGAALGKEWCEARISGDVVCFNHIVYPLAGILAYATPAQQGSTTAYLWTFTPAQSADDTIKTFTVEHGSSARAGRFAYGLMNELALEFDREKVSVSGSMVGHAYEDGITMTSSPTAVPVQVVMPTMLNVYMNDTYSGIGTTKLTRVLSGSFSISDRFGQVWVLNSDLASFAAHVEQAPKAQIKLMLEANSEGMALLNAMRSGTKKFIRIKAVGPLIAGTYYYTFQLDACGIVTEVGEFSDEDGVYAVEWTFDIAYDSGWGKSLEVKVTNTLSGL